MISHKLEMALVMAIREAKIHRHEYVTVEHILYGLLHDDLAVQILAGCGFQPDSLKKKLEEFFETNLPVSKESKNDPIQTVGFNRVLQRAIAHVQSSGKKEVNPGDVLVAIFAEPDSFAVYFLKKEGISIRLSAVIGSLNGSCRSSAVAGRTTRCWSANPGSAKPLLLKALPSEFTMIRYRIS